MIKAKRFWKNVSILEDDGYRVLLDERELKTPYKSILNIPTRALAEAVAKEWESVDGEINPALMPMTKMSNSAIDQVGAKREEVQEHLLEYVDFDLISYRSSEPKELAERQQQWDNWVDWAKRKGLVLNSTSGILPIAQPARNRVTAEHWIRGLSDYELVSFYEFLTISGSFTLSMAIFEDELSVQEGFDLSRIDEDYQAEIWGAVDVKIEERQQKNAAILNAGNFLTLVHSQL